MFGYLENKGEILSIEINEINTLVRTYCFSATNILCYFHLLSVCVLWSVLQAC